MALGLYVDRMKCYSSVDSADDIYMVIFGGAIRSLSESWLGVVGPGDYWDDFDDDEVWNNDIYIAKYYGDNTYVVALAEVDADNDLTDNGGKYTNLLQSADAAHLAGLSHRFTCRLTYWCWVLAAYRKAAVRCCKCCHRINGWNIGCSFHLAGRRR